MNEFKVRELVDSDNEKFRVNKGPMLGNNKVDEQVKKEEKKEFGKMTGSNTPIICSLLELNSVSLYKGILFSEILGLPKCKRIIPVNRLLEIFKNYT